MALACFEQNRTNKIRKPSHLTASVSSIAGISSFLAQTSPVNYVADAQGFERRCDGVNHVADKADSWVIT